MSMGPSQETLRENNKHSYENTLHYISDTVDGRNPPPVDRYIVYLIIYRVLYIPGGAGLLPSTVTPAKKCV